MESPQDMTAEEFDRLYLEPSNERLEEERQRLEKLYLELQSLSEYNQTALERMRALVTTLESHKPNSIEELEAVV